jgi:hypothetical protein
MNSLLHIKILYKVMNELYQNRVKASIASLFNMIVIEVISKGNTSKTTILSFVFVMRDSSH